MLSHMLLARGATVPTRTRTASASFEEEVRANRIREFHALEVARRAAPQRWRRPPTTAPGSVTGA